MSIEKYGDFCGFTFNGVHSSEMGFIRVSNSNRYTENLLPTFQDKTVQVPGADGTYFFDSYYTQRTFQIDIAFDSMTELDMRKMRQVFSTKEMGPLIFDEVPYKAYVAKVQGQPQLKYICFDEDGHRVYKGEGTIQFICYSPYARSVNKFLSQYNATDYPNKDDWAEASGMLETNQIIIDGSTEDQKEYVVIDGSGDVIDLYNPGDVATDFCAFYNFTNSSLDLRSISLGSDILTFTSDSTAAVSIPAQDGDYGIRINSKTNLIEGCDSSGNLTGTLYNNYIYSGDFFKIPISTSSSDIYHFITTPTTTSCNSIEYNYLYY